jgi:hypothetical protein
MTLKQTFCVALLTALYLCFELAFNARLLDVVGSLASESEIHAMELRGRLLSGVAVALFVLQGLLVVRNRRGARAPGAVMVALYCAAAGALVFFGLTMLSDYLVNRSSPAFRRASMNVVLVQSALVSGTVRIDGFNRDARVFANPEGKAALALLPLMAVSFEALEKTVEPIRLALIQSTSSQRLTAAEYFDCYAKAVTETGSQWKRYSSAGDAAHRSTDVDAAQDKAWNDYLGDLRKHRWSPTTIPDRYRPQVMRKVKGRLPVPDDWDLADEQVFRQAVARKMSTPAVRTKGVTHNGQMIPFGLDWPGFFANPAVQSDLHNKLGLPKSVLLRPNYRSGDDFERTVFDPMMRDRAGKPYRAYHSDVATFADGGVNAGVGLDAARAAIVPALALFFSLLGALGHLSKLVFLLLKGLLQAALPGHRVLGYVWLVPVLLFGGAALALSRMDNEVTRSDFYGLMRQHMLQQSGTSQSSAMAHGLHMVAVGQGLFYPFDEAIRTRVLGNMTFGYGEPGSAKRACTTDPHQ